ncbi:DUF222 domain-containing protein [Actinomycetospora sp. CA-084318]|uniref:HNH endonuclease signature motif containing protein n=1 Tax=Actinomycetospora sp. CA-084318 TaxID=3239892 RepID=UPI003D987BC1
MAIEAGWDPEAGLPLPTPPSWEPEEPAWVPPAEEDVARWEAENVAVLRDAVFPWAEYEHEEPAAPAAEPGWAVPGVSSDAEPSGEPSGDDGLSPESAALLAEAAAAVRAQRLAGARLYRSLRALRRSEVLAETGYRRMGRLLEDHLRIDPKTVTSLERQADALSETVTPTGATTPADLPATASVVDDGLVDEHHVEIIRKTMERLGKVPDLDDAIRAVAEEQLASLAATLSPKGLASAARAIADRLDPDGAAPKDDHAAGNELHYTKRRNGDLHAKLILRESTAAALFEDAIRAATPAPVSSVVADPETGAAPVSEDGARGQDPRDEADRSKPSRQASGLLDLISASHHAGLNEPEHPGAVPFPDLDRDFDTTAWPPDPTDEDTENSDPADDTDKADEAEPGSRTGTGASGTGSRDAGEPEADATGEHRPDEHGPDEHAADRGSNAGTGATGTGPGGTGSGDPSGPEPVDTEDTEPAHEADPASRAGSGAAGTGSADPAGPDPEKSGEPPLFGPGPPDPDADPERESEPPPHRPWTPPDFDAMALPGRERVTLTVTLDYETLRQQLADTSTALALLGDSTWIRPDTARRLACDADLIPMVLGSKGEVLDVGRKTRAIPTATGRAVVRRDRHCAFPGCAKKARHSEIHHIIHWAHGGHTEPDNLVCLCRYHHDLVHHGGWQVHMIDHLPWFTPPTWLDPTRQPRHNRPWQVVSPAA